MTGSTRQRVENDIGFGLIAGVIFATMAIVAAAIMGDPPLMPFRMVASIALGQATLDVTPIATVVVVASIVHLLLSVLFGLVYGLITGDLRAETRMSWGEQACFGLGFGAALWLVNFQILAPMLFPWFMAAPQLLQMLMHAIFFGLPLALMHAGAERRARVHRTPTPAV